APLFDSVIAPVKLLLEPFVVKFIAFAPALKLEVPGTVSVPVCEIAPFELTVKFCPTDEAANDVAILLAIDTLLLPLFDKVIVPEKLLLILVKLIALLPAVKLDVPGTTIAPLCEIN